MEMTYPKVMGYRIKRRTFEGKTDPTKNDDSLTSKYMPSYKYWIEVEFEDGNKRTDTRPTKRECLEFVARLKLDAGKPM